MPITVISQMQSGRFDFYRRRYRSQLVAQVRFTLCYSTQGCSLEDAYNIMMNNYAKMSDVATIAPWRLKLGHARWVDRHCMLLRVVLCFQSSGSLTPSDG